MSAVFTLKSFGALSTTELYDLLQLRSEVFVVEQTCPYLDPDGKDQQSLHLLGYSDKKLAAYARLLPPGLSYPEASIGRVVVSPAFRNQKLAWKLMEEAIRLTQDEFQVNEIVVSAQQYLEDFYTKLGFITEGEPYPEDNIPHVKMRRHGR